MLKMALKENATVGKAGDTLIVPFGDLNDEIAAPRHVPIWHNVDEKSPSTHTTIVVKCGLLTKFLDICIYPEKFQIPSEYLLRKKFNMGTDTN